MLTPTTAVPHSPSHVRRNPRGVVGGEAVLASDRRHAMLVAAHRLVRPALRPEWLRWLENKLAPGQKVF